MEFQKESQKIIIEYLKHSLKCKDIIIHKGEFKDRAHQIYPQIGLAFKLQLDEDKEPQLIDNQLVCAAEDEKEREEIVEELFKLCKQTFNHKAYD